MWDNAGRDCEYGNYRDMNNDYDWADDFWPRAKECSKAIEYYDDRIKDLVEEIAYSFFGLNTDDWDSRDFEIFKERVGIY